MYRLLALLTLIILPIVSWANVSLSTKQKQGFETFTEGSLGSTFSCKQQCFVVLSEMGVNEFIQFQGTLSGKGEIGYGFLNGNQVIPGEFLSINGDGKMLEKTFLFTDSPYYSQIPKNIQILLIVSGNIRGEGFTLDMNLFTPLNRLKERFQEASQYIPFSPRSINFLEGPTWGGRYINEVFFGWIVFFLIIGFFWSFFEKQPNHHTMKKSVYFSLGILALFWVFFDILHSMNQYKMYKDFQSAESIMENGRLGKDSDFYDFIAYAKTQIPNRAKGTFISPYPFLIEGKYHSYPDIKFDEVDKTKYLIWYNPYGGNAPFGYKNPIIQSGSLQYGTGTYVLEKEITWKEYAKIYILKK